MKFKKNRIISGRKLTSLLIEAQNLIDDMDTVGIPSSITDIFQTAFVEFENWTEGKKLYD